VLAFVLQHPLEHGPATVENGLRHSGSDQLLAAHVAYDDRFVLIDYLATELMERIGSASRGLAM
jgi:hypothetical protein